MSVLSSDERSNNGAGAEPVLPDAAALPDDGADLTDEQLAAQQPADIDEAVRDMRRTLIQFHRQRDKRAIFLRVYYIMTLEVHAAIHNLGRYSEPIFYDADWVKSLSGKFSSLYFRSFTEVQRPGTAYRAWKVASETAGDKHSSVVQNALQGINAHINHDLAQALAANLDPNDLQSYRTMQLRKFDHDQVNNLLIRTLPYIQDVLARDYERGITLADHLLGNIDEQLSTLGLKHYRERVWWDGMAFAAAQVEQKQDLVREKLNWESFQIARFINSKGWLWRLERMLGFLTPWRRTRPWNEIKLEGKGGVPRKSGVPLRPVR